MNTYETLMLSVPEITDDECNKLEAQFSKTVAAAKGETVSFEKWGKYRLAYPVKNNEYGIYFLTRYKLPSGSTNEALKELKSFFSIKFNEIVMREMTCVLSDGSLEYKKPKALEDLPDDAVDSFLRENKMEGLLKKDDKAKAKYAKAEDAPKVEAASEKVEAPAKEASTEEAKAESKESEEVKNG